MQGNYHGGKSKEHMELLLLGVKAEKYKGHWMGGSKMYEEARD